MKNKYLQSLEKEVPVFYRPKIMCGYCENRIKELPKKSVGLIIDDPPYGITKNQWDKEPNWKELSQLYNDVLEDNGLIYIFGKQPMLSNVMNAFKEYFEFRFELIWNKKNNPWVSNHMPIPIHENIFVFKKKCCLVEKTKFYLERVKEKGKPYKKNRKPSDKSATHGKYTKDFTLINNGWRYPKSILEMSLVNGSHKEYCRFSTQKPLELIDWIVKASSDPNDTILDPHAGSGTTCISSFKMCRRSIGIELNPDNVYLINSRLEELEIPQDYIREYW